MHKIRPGRILSGFTKAAKSAITGTDKDFVKQRKKYCFEPCEHNVKGTCGLCGCFLMAKTQEELEYCPANKWEDIKIMDTLGIAVRNLSTHKVKLTISTERQIEIEYLQGIKQGDDTNIKLQIINDRANVQNDIKLNLTNIRVVTSCGCTKTTTTPERLVDGDSFILGISYDRKEKSNGNFAQSIAFRSNEDNFFIRLKGVRV